MWTEVWSVECQFDVALLAGRGKDKFWFRQLCSKILIGLINISLEFFLNVEAIHGSGIISVLRHRLGYYCEVSS